MNFRTTVILLVLLAGALVFYVAANWSGSADTTSDPTPVGKPDDPEKGRKLLAVKADDVRKLVVTPGEGAPAGSKPIEMTQADGKWTIVQPVSWPADSFEGRGFVDAIASARSIGSIDLDAGNLASTGLAKPRFRVELTDAAGKTHKLAVGERSALGHLYVQANDEKTGSLVAGGPLGERLGRGTDKLVAGLRDKQILKIQSFDVKQVEVARGGGAPALALQKGTVDWTLTAPVKEPAESSEVSDLVSAVTGLRAEEFADEASASSQGASFDRPRAVVTLSAAAPSTQPTTAPAGGPSTAPATPAKMPGGVTVVVGQPVDIEGEKAWVKVFGPAATDPVTVAKVSLNQAAVDKLTKATPLSLRDRRVFTAAADQVSELTITTEAPTAGGTTQPAGATRPAAKTVRLARRVEKPDAMGPFLPKGPATAPAATQPAAAPSAPVPSAAVPSATPSTQPASGPATKPSALLRTGGSPLLALIGLLQAAPTVAVEPHATTQPTVHQSAETQPSAGSLTKSSSTLTLTGQSWTLTSPATGPAATQPASGSLDIAGAGTLTLTGQSGTLALPATGSATTQPSTQPVPTPSATTPSASTQPAATPPTATGPATAPAAVASPPIPVEPPKPPTKWVVASAGEADADDAAVTALLSDFGPLRATKYLDKAPPTTQPAAATYVVTVKTVAAGGAVTSHELHVTDPGGESKPVGRYNDLVFEMDREVVTKLKAEFAAKKP
jgi:hypothetical protein